MNSLEQQLIDELLLFGIKCTPEQAKTLIEYLKLVIEKNKVVNLTRISDPSTAVTLHMVDSLLPLALLHESMTSESSYVDMGTGAGFPGVPLGVLTGATGVLVDSVNKKVSAVTEFIDRLGLDNLQAVHMRVEDLSADMRHQFDFVFARAVAQTNILIEYATPFLRMGGLLVVQKGRPEEAELLAAEKASHICGLELVSRETFELPHDSGHREILIYKRIKKSKLRLPRKAGTAKKSPLGI